MRESATLQSIAFLTPEQRAYVDHRVEKEAPSLLLAYLLWLLLGGVGAHRFYMRKLKSGIAMALVAVVIGLLAGPWVALIIVPWMLLDLFLIPTWRRNARQVIEAKHTDFFWRQKLTQ